MKPLVFNDTIGWLKEADGGLGVVIAGAHGFEDLCSRRFLTLLADRIAHSGSPVLQFDYPGCGNAAGDHTVPGRVAAWVDSIGAAVDELKRRTGVAKVIVIGFRLGASLAALAVEKRGRDDIAGLVLLAPLVSGKAYVREMRALSRMIDAALPSGEPEGEPFDGRTVAGFRLSAETLTDIGSLGWQEVAPASSALPILVMTPVQAPALLKWVGDFAGSPANVVFDEFDGYGRLMCDPTANMIPASVIERCAGWVDGHARSGHPAKPVIDIDVPVLADSGYVETPVVIGPGPNICGVLCRPPGDIKAKDVVIFLNSGAVPHIGWARGTVESARMLAAGGIASLRIDLPGLGQSDAPEEERLFLYDARGSTDVSRTIDWLERNGFGRVSLAGICSGAFQAFHAARADRRVHRLVMINPLCFSWNSSYALDMTVWKAYETAKAVREPSENDPQRSGRPRYLAAFKALTSKNNRRFVRHGLEAVKTTLATAHPLATMRRKPVERWMRDLVNNGVHVLIATSEGDLSLKEIDRHFGPDGERLRTMPNIGRLSLPDADHTLTPLHARRTLVSRLIGHARDLDSRAIHHGWNGDHAVPATSLQMP